MGLGLLTRWSSIRNVEMVGTELVETSPGCREFTNVPYNIGLAG